MEEIDDQDTDKSLDDKFRRITKIFILLFLLAFFYNNVKKMDRVAFELWWLCCKYIQKNYQKDKKFFIKNRYDWKKTTAYIPELFHSVPSGVFDE